MPQEKLAKDFYESERYPNSCKWGIYVMCQADVLTLIKTFGPVSSLQLGKALGLNASTIAQSVKRLRDQGEIYHLESKRSGGRCGYWVAVI